MKPKAHKEFLQHSFRLFRPTYTLGGPGIGKTQKVFQAAAEIDYEVLPPLYLASLDPVDIGGLNLPTMPDANGIRKLERLLDDWLEPAFVATKNTVLLLDEVSQGSQGMQNAAAPLFDQRRCGKHKLPDCVVVTATGNKRAHRAGAIPTLTQLISRAARITLEVDPLAWLDQAIKDKIAPEILSFIRTYPSLLDVSLRPQFKEDEGYEQIYQSGLSYENPRSWYEVSHYVKSKLPVHLEKEVYEGIVGESAIALLIPHLTLIRQEIDIVAILQGASWKFPSKDKIGARFSFALGVGACATSKTYYKVLEIAKELYDKKEHEYASVIIQTAVKAYREIVDTQEWLYGLRQHPLGKAFIATRQV